MKLIATVRKSGSPEVVSDCLGPEVRKSGSPEVFHVACALVAWSFVWLKPLGVPVLVAVLADRTSGLPDFRTSGLR